MLLAKVTVPKIGVAKPTFSYKTLPQWILGWLFWFAGAIAVGFLVYAGILFVTAQGDEEQIKKARNTALYAFIGVIIIFASIVIINTVKTFTP